MANLNHAACTSSAVVVSLRSPVPSPTSSRATQTTTPPNRPPLSFSYPAAVSLSTCSVYSRPICYTVKPFFSACRTTPARAQDTAQTSAPAVLLPEAVLCCGPRPSSLPYQYRAQYLDHIRNTPDTLSPITTLSQRSAIDLTVTRVGHKQWRTTGESASRGLVNNSDSRTHYRTHGRRT